MARSYANIFCAIWADRDFCALGSDAQRTYFMLITQSEITACGTLPLTLKRWANTLPERDRDRLAPSLAELVDNRFVIVDEDTEELFVRSFAKHDGGYKHSVRVKAVIAYALAVRSLSIRTAVALELQKLGLNLPTGEPLESHSTGTGEAIEVGWDVVTKVFTDHIPQTTSLNPDPGTWEGASHKAAHPRDHRCEDHRALPLGEEPPCRKCKRNRIDIEAKQVAEEAAERAAKTAAHDRMIACPNCNQYGQIEDRETRLPAGICDHEGVIQCS